MEQSLESFGSWFRELYHLDKPDVREYSALTLAYIGDAVYEIIIRSYIVGKGNAPVERLHKRSSRLVKAETQANLIMAIEGTCRLQKRPQCQVLYNGQKCNHV